MSCETEKTLPIPEVLNISLLRRESDIGEIFIEYKIPDTNIPFSGVVVFLRPINDPLNFPKFNINQYKAGDLNQNDIHYTFLPPKKGQLAQIQIHIPLYVTYQAGIATYKLHEHTTIIPKNALSETDVVADELESSQVFELSPVKTLKKTFPEKLELKEPGTLRIEIEPDEDIGPSFLELASKDASQQYRLTETFIDEFKNTKNLDTNKNFNIDFIPGPAGFVIRPSKDILFEDSVELIEGLKAPNQPTTFILQTPVETPDVYKFDSITWSGKDIKVYVATGFGAGDVTETENFREIQSGADLKANIGEDTLNLRVDFLKEDSYIENVLLEYTRYEPSLIVTKTINTKQPFNRAVTFVNGDNLEKIYMTLSNNGGKTFIEPTPGEGVDLFNFEEFGNQAVLRIEIFGPNFLEGYSLSVGDIILPPIEPIDNIRPVEI